MKKVIVILGPTGIGKTKLSIEIAKSINGEIISGDSIQVYKRLDIGSAKIKKEEMEGIKHHLIDILDYNEEYSVSLFQKMVREKIEEINYPIICGGTGLYIDAAIRDYRFSKERDKSFEDKYKDLSNQELYDLLMKIDPKCSYLHPNNRKRVLRAIEVYQNDNTSISENKDGNKLIYDCLILGLSMNRDKLYDRINKRVDIMIEDGLLEEVKSLYDEGLDIHAIGYKEFYPYFKGEITLDMAIDKVKQNSRHYAKRQMTWFRHNDDITIIDMENENVIADCINLVKNFLKER